MSFRSGFVSIIGRPNAGKSTLLNKLVGQKVAIVTHKPQTTRHRVQGIVNLEARKGRPAGQVVFIDTPGVHRPESSLNRKMMREVQEALENRDLVLLIVDASQSMGAGDRFTLDLVKKVDAPVFLLLNKIDLIEKGRLLPLIDRYSKLHTFQEIIPISATKGDGLELLLDRVAHVLPEGPRYFPKDQVTDQPERFLVAELIREKVLLKTQQELPYATTVRVEQFEESPQLTRIAAAIYCEREGQKGILIGRGGAMLKRIGSEARREIEALLGGKVFLELFVKVQPGWRDSREFVEGLDWRRQLEDLAESGEPPEEP
ncbi:MAG TPA: GTPase Era [Terriglobales bacterium]|jgi:GTP-binding protein Era|nr:GTPase Era [Terriglobales bacterium]